MFEIHGLAPGKGAPSLEEAIGYYHKDDRAEVEAAVSKALEDGTPFQFQLRLIRKDGEEIKVEASGAPITDEDGNVQSVVGVFRQLPEDTAQPK